MVFFLGISTELCVIVHPVLQKECEKPHLSMTKKNSAQARKSA
jgi:hypothetical protein